MLHFILADTLLSPPSCSAYKDVNVPLGLLRQSRYRVKKAEGESGRKGPCFGIYGGETRLGIGARLLMADCPVEQCLKSLNGAT